MKYLFEVGDNVAAIPEVLPLVDPSVFINDRYKIVFIGDVINIENVEGKRIISILSKEDKQTVIEVPEEFVYRYATDEPLITEYKKRELNNYLEFIKDKVTKTLYRVEFKYGDKVNYDTVGTYPILKIDRVTNCWGIDNLFYFVLNNKVERVFITGGYENTLDLRNNASDLYRQSVKLFTDLKYLLPFIDSNRKEFYLDEDITLDCDDYDCSVDVDVIRLLGQLETSCYININTNLVEPDSDLKYIDEVRWYLQELAYSRFCDSVLGSLTTECKEVLLAKLKEDKE
jgi:hypothetical protein